MKIRNYFRFFIMTEVVNLATYLGVTLVYFHNDDRGGYFVRKIDGRMFMIFLRILRISLFKYPPRILDGFTR